MPIEINGTGSITGVDSLSTPAVTNAAGSASAPSITFTGDVNTGLYSPGADQVAVTTGGTARLLVDASGRLLVGTSTSRSVYTGNYASQLQIEGRGSGAGRGSLSIINNDAGSNPVFLALGKSNINSIGGTTLVANGEWLGNISFQGTDGTNLVPAAYIDCYVDGTPGANDMPGRLVFSTTGDGASSPTERMRIKSNGTVEVSSSIGAGENIAKFTNSSSTGNGIFTSVNSDGTGYTFFQGYSASALANRILIYTNGNVVNANNSYGAISDAKLKENVVDANSQWDDLKALRVRNYNLKEGQTHTQIGLVAQEVELVSPGLVTESPDRDADGNDLGTVTKSVNYSVLYMKAVKALQEAMERIETLEAKVAALESA